jgi:hypothetical protein
MNYGIAFIEDGFRPVITKEGPKWTHVVFIDGIQVKTLRVKGQVRCRDMGEQWTMKKLATRLLRKKNCLGLSVQITKGAQKILREACHE